MANPAASLIPSTPPMSLETQVRQLAAWVFTIVLSSAGILLMLLGFRKTAWKVVIQRWGQTYLSIMGVKLEQQGRENLKKPCVIAGNHRSMLDMWVYPAAVPPHTSYVMKREFAWIPFVGWFVALGGAIRIDRSNREKAAASLRQGIAGLPEGWCILMMPEGTRSNSEAMGPLRKGILHVAVEAGLPIVPMGTYWRDQVFPNGTWVPRPGVAHVTFGEPIDTRDWDLTKTDEHLETVRNSIEQCMNSSRARGAEYQATPVESATGAGL